MEVPGIFSRHSSMQYFKTTDYDFLEANTFDEFFEKGMFLRNNKDFYTHMIENCRKRKNEVTNKCIVEQIEAIERRVNDNQQNN